MKPILFNIAMVQAILEGRKTCTRRVAKGLKDATKVTHGEFKWDYKHSWMNDLGLEIAAPFHIGEILYVRETWLAHSRGLNTLAFKYKADGAVADCVSFKKERFNKFYKFADQERWQPSLFMPVEAARIFLKVTDVRVERLQDITEDGIKAEGITEEFPPIARDNFQELWDSTTKEYRWRLNPYVWVISFERCEKPNE
ncbi:hypothetical protein NE172_10680 [Clostridium botulinum]|uniref:Uncharacterized protein n=1 Tax=Clostridium botulinum TaxID=1491 RepID=A0A6B4JNJ9_CLOBO|nr:hypothetical protein [Clostridium botulinum]EES48679.1 Upf86.8 [Clostridium botulinum E1 str. 'BoNT E Beluga']MBY6761899.1 hypothetical protein [Clostridium botulinum]MBY6920825.1 hypothetical protein [Clostridium botulinum]MCR1131426.1 hypothetical protein [Clostridium botulinum]NFJ58666.1 hypothetical protein [Clostridium botulinum]